MDEMRSLRMNIWSIVTWSVWEHCRRFTVFYFIVEGRRESWIYQDFFMVSEEREKYWWFWSGLQVMTGCALSSGRKGSARAIQCI